MFTIYEAKREEIEITSARGEDRIKIEDEETYIADLDIQKIQKKVKPTESKLKVSNPDDPLSGFMRDFLEKYKDILLTQKTAIEGKIKVSEVLGGIARLYERARATVEYKGEHVLRRNAIERILKRLAWEKESLRDNLNPQKIAETLIRELIWARYVPNDEIPLSAVEKVRDAISKYAYILDNLDAVPGVSASTVRVWIWGVASSEIEDVLDPSNREDYVVLMYEWFKAYFDWAEGEIEESEKDIQIYLSIHRAFPKSDDAIMRYHLLLREVPDWLDADMETVLNFIKNFERIYGEVESHLNFPGNLLLYRKMQKHSAAFEILRELTENKQKDFEKFLTNSGKLEKKIREVCEAKYKTIKVRVNTGIVRSIIYIFVTKVVFAILLEVPYEVVRYGDISYLPMSVNIIFPPFLMFLIGLSIRIPGVKNTEMLTERIKSIVYKKTFEGRQIFTNRVSKKTSNVALFFWAMYAILFLAVFGGLSFLLRKLNFSFVGMGVFFIFISLVVLFAFRVRYHANRLKIESEREGLFSVLGGYITLPFLNLGYYLSKGLAKINFVTVLFDFMIEVPLKNIIEVFEDWTSFLREKREEVIEIPE